MSRLSRNFSLLVCLLLILSAPPIPAQTMQIQHGVPWRDAGAPSSFAPAGAHLSYFGGPVISNAHVVQVLYGPGAYNPQVAGSISPTMGNFFSDILGINSGYINLLSQYSTSFSGGTNETIGNGTFDGVFQITPSAANNGSTIDDTNIQAEILSQVSAGHLPAPVLDAAGNVNTLYMIYFPPGKTITERGSTSCVSGGFCAYHGTTSSTLNAKHLLYGVLPDMQAGSSCSIGCGTSSVFGNYTSVTSHELSEAITDADVGIATSFAAPLAWYDTSNGEIGDICNQQQGSYTANGTTYTIQLEFSNAANSCVLPPTASNPAVFEVWRPSNGTWFVKRVSDGSVSSQQWGVNGDVPLLGDFDGDSRPDFAVWRPSNGTWYIIRSSDGSVVTPQWGLNGDIPVPGDYDGDGRTDLAVWRPSNGTWYIIRSSDGSVMTPQWGLNGDIPVPGDYDGDRRTDFAVWRPSNGTWFVIRSSDGSVVTQPWGLNGDIPVNRPVGQ